MSKQAILILGMHRSGTSLLAGLLNRQGYDIGPTVMQNHPSNPKGFFENNAAYLLNERILSEMGSSWDDLTDTLIDKTDLIRERFLPEIKDLVSDQFGLVDRFLIKDPRLCLLYPAWAAALDELGIDHRVVIPYRQPLEVAYSLKTRDGFPLNKGLLLWCNHLLHAELLSRGTPRAFVSQTDLLEDAAGQLEALLASLGYPLPEDHEIDADLVDSKLVHHRVSYDSITQDLPEPVWELIALAREGNFSDTEKLDAIRETLAASRDFFIHPDTQYTTRNRRHEQQLQNQIQQLQKNVQEKQQQFNQKQGEANGLRNQLQQKNQELTQLRQSHQATLAERQKETQGIREQLAQARQQLAEANERIDNLQQPPATPVPKPVATTATVAQDTDTPPAAPEAVSRSAE